MHGVMDEYMSCDCNSNKQTERLSTCALFCNMLRALKICPKIVWYFPWEMILGAVVGNEGFKAP
jgi:hypothetical protein